MGTPLAAYSVVIGSLPGITIFKYNKTCNSVFLS